MAVKTGKLSAFYQELMLRITSSEERLVQDEEIGWYDRSELLKHPERYNFYMTTDFATSAKQTADDSVIADWAYNANRDWFWVDGFCEKCTMDKSINQLFAHVLKYKPQQVGVEVSGQQGAFVTWLQGEQMRRNIWFNFASDQAGGAPGIRPVQDKLTRFNLVVPWFKMKKIWFPKEMKGSKIVGKYLEQIRLATQSGLKGKDDCIDTISQLAYLKPWLPSEAAPSTAEELSMWENDRAVETHSIDSYIV